MNDQNIIWIWWNIAPPNPRLASYLISPYENAKNKSRDILLTSSLDQAIKNEKNKSRKEKIKLNTVQKIKFAKRFASEFYPSLKISSDFSNHSNKFDSKVWLKFWDEIEKNMRSTEREKAYSILRNISPNSDISIWKVYSSRHPFWFKDIVNKQEKYIWKRTTYWWPAESFFNLIRKKSEQVDNGKIKQIFGEDLVKKKVEQIITPTTSRVVPYWEATRKSWKKRISIELPVSSNSNITDFYNWRQQKKAELNKDIENIEKAVWSEKYEDFWSDFSKQYQNDKNNI